MSPRSARGPGRPPAGENADTRQQIIASARKLFADKGFSGATVRSIAADAGVDPGLIRHYFGDKAGLLVATMQLPINPQEILRRVFAAGPDGLGTRIIRTFLTQWDPHRDVLSGLIRTTIAGSDQSPPVLDLVRSIVLAELLTLLEGADRELRASLVVAQLIGLATLRYVLRLEPLASAPIDTVTEHYGPLLQRLITPSGR